MEHLVLSNSEVVLNLIEVQKALRKIPIVQLGTPTVVLVGAPNVGKSSIVRAISSGTPEVNNYPFTTRGMTLGHVTYDDWASEKCQVMDTPGVLNRPDGERNEMEALTLASMQHLPTAVMFVLDLTGNSGALSSIENQIQIRNDLRARFPKRPWVDVISKADLPMDETDPAVAYVAVLLNPQASLIAASDFSASGSASGDLKTELGPADVRAHLRLPLTPLLESMRVRREDLIKDRPACKEVLRTLAGYLRFSYDGPEGKPSLILPYTDMRARRRRAVRQDAWKG